VYVITTGIITVAARHVPQPIHGRPSGELLLRYINLTLNQYQTNPIQVDRVVANHSLAELSCLLRLDEGAYDAVQLFSALQVAESAVWIIVPRNSMLRYPYTHLHWDNTTVCQMIRKGIQEDYGPISNWIWLLTEVEQGRGGLGFDHFSSLEMFITLRPRFKAWEVFGDRERRRSNSELAFNVARLDLFDKIERALYNDEFLVKETWESVDTIQRVFELC
jgi:hypothetical protein